MKSEFKLNHKTMHTFEGLPYCFECGVDQARDLGYEMPRKCYGCNNQTVQLDYGFNGKEHMNARCLSCGYVNHKHYRKEY